MKREAFLQRVRAAAAAGRAYRVPAERREFGRYAPPSRESLLERIALEVTAVGGVCHRPANRQELAELIRGLCLQHDCRRALLWRHATLERLGVREILDKSAVEWLDAERVAALDAATQRVEMLRATLGITGVDAAVAETGSVAVHAACGQERSASLLPTVHLAIVDAEAVLPDLFDYFDRLSPEGLPSNITLITGPSKTGDLELRLVTGVHGPRHWHVALVAF